MSKLVTFLMTYYILIENIIQSLSAKYYLKTCFSGPNFYYFNLKILRFRKIYI